MGFRFRKSIKMGPVRVNLSKSGVGYSVGGKGLRVTKKAGGGVQTTARIPGTGISYSQSIGGKKSSSQSTSTRKTTTKSTGSNTTSGKGGSGCLSAILWIVGIALLVGLIKNYWWVLLIIALLGGAAFFLFRYLKRQKEISDEPIEIDEKKAPFSEAECVGKTLHAPSVENSHEIENEQTSTSDLHSRMDALIERFESEVAGIPVKQLAVSDPVPRQLLKDLPLYEFSNVTRKTRLDSIFPLVVLDVETTDLRPSYGEIIEISAIKFDTGMIPVEAISTLCKPQKPIPADATAINHITDEMVQDYPRFAEIAPAVTEFMRGCHVAGHNLDFDLRFLHANGAQLPEGIRFYDTLDLAHLTVPNSSIYDYKLDTLCSYYGIWRGKSHRALSDCYATAKVFASLVKDKTDRQLIANPDETE